MQIRAAVLSASNIAPPYAEKKPLVIETVTLEGPGRDEVLIKMTAAGVCHSDLSVINGDRPRPVPMVLGHEGAGTVVECGPGVTDLAPGDQVVCIFVPSCGCCAPCSEGRPALCEPGARHNVAGDLLTGTRRLSLNGQSLHHHIGVSCFAEYATMARRSVIKIDKNVAPHIAALFSCAVITGVGTVINAAQIKAGDRVAVIGLGGVGLAALLGALASGAEQVIGIDPLASKLEFAQSLGATDVLLASDPDCVAKVKDLTSGGVDVAIEFAGVAKALEMAYTITRRGGMTVTGGVPHPDAQMQLPALSLVAEEKTLRGSYLGSAVPTRDIPRMIALYQRGRLPVDKLLTDRMPLDDINLAMDRLHSGAAIRQIIDF